MRLTVTRYIGAFLLSSYMYPGVGHAQNVSVLSSAPTTNRAGTAEIDPTRVAVPVSASSDLGGEGQRGVTPSLGFQIWQRDRFFLGAFFTIAAADNSVTESYG